MITVEHTIEEILECARFLLSNIKPSAWAEQNRMMSSDISPIPGMLSYKNSPYTKEIVDCLAPDHPARIIAVMKGAQIGFSTTVIEAAIGWIISQNPGNILFLVGHDDLVEEAIAKVDRMIDSSGLRHLIKPTINRRKNMKTGDTNRKKEFPGGSLISGIPSNHKLLRNRSIQYGFIDDFEAAKGSTTQSGSTAEMIEQRFAAYSKKMKLFYISTPELKQTSNIEPVYLLGDRRKYHIPCPKCAEFIDLQWSIQLEGSDKDMAGMVWKVDGNGKLIEGSVGYVCQKCGGFFNDSNKNDLVQNGFWKPTTEPSQIGYYSYHISSLYAPSYMYDWEHYVRKYIAANPSGEPRNEALFKTFTNLCLGLPFEATGESPKANELQKNIRNYSIASVPEKISVNDGNGKIVILTCACDLNGKPEDARLDYEIVAWSESGASYSVDHGSIGTFIANESGKKNKVERERWTYEHNRPNSVWREFYKVMTSIFIVDVVHGDAPRRMPIFITGVDTGYCEKEAFEFIDKYEKQMNIYGLKGDKEHKYVKFGANIPNFVKGRSRSNLYMLQVNQLKDDLANLMRLKWDEGNDESQPSGFMNYPIPSDGKYLFKNFFSHYEAEFRDVESSKDGEAVGARWRKKTAIAQNHFWDVRIYNMALLDIIQSFVFKEMKIASGTWKDFCDIILGKIK